jgi:hypothetical protein
MYRVGNGLGYNGKDFVKHVQQLYKQNQENFPLTKRPTTIKASIAFAKRLGYKVYSKEAGWDWFLIG